MKTDNYVISSPAVEEICTRVMSAARREDRLEMHAYNILLLEDHIPRMTDQARIERARATIQNLAKQRIEIMIMLGMREAARQAQQQMEAA